MRRLRRAEDRGQSNRHGVDVRYSISSGPYLDPDYMGFGSLRALDEERFPPGTGFPAREHANTERVTVVFEGELRHEDDIGNQTTLTPGQIQCVTLGAGTRLTTSNPSSMSDLHTYSAWFIPRADDLVPSYQLTSIPFADWDDRWSVLASPDGRENSVRLSTTTLVLGAIVSKGTDIDYQIELHRGVWLQIVRGEIEADSDILKSGDGLEISSAGRLRIKAVSRAQVLLFDLEL